MIVRRWGLEGTLLSTFLALSLFLILVPSTPARTLGGWGTDHASHTSTALLFAARGFDVYRHSVRELATLIEPNTFVLSEAPSAPPLRITWNSYPRPYPPGIFVFSAGEAALYRAGVPFHIVNTLTLLKYLFFGHLLIYAFVRAWSLVTAKLSMPHRIASALVVSCVACNVLFFSMTGFYDALPVLLVVGSLHWGFARGRPGLALLALSGAFFLHFRAIWYLPLAVVLAGKVIATLRQERFFGRTGVLIDVLAALLALPFAGVALYALLLIRGALASFPVNNWVYAGDAMAAHGAALVGFLVLLTGLAFVLLRARAYLALATVLWQSLVLLFTPQTQWWHVLFMIPLFLFPLSPCASPPRVPARAALCVWVAIQAVLVFRTDPLGIRLPVWLFRDLFSWLS